MAMMTRSEALSELSALESALQNDMAISNADICQGREFLAEVFTALGATQDEITEHVYYGKKS